MLWLSGCRRHHDNIIIGAVYRPGSSADNDLTLIDHLDSHLDEVRQFGSNIILAGDFNVHNAACLRSTKTTPAGEALEDVCVAHHLAQHVADSTRGNNTLDFVISDFEGPVATAIHPHPQPPIGCSDHAVTTCFIFRKVLCRKTFMSTASFTSAALHINQPTTRKLWRYSSADWARLRHFFGTTHWSAVINDNPNHSCLNITQRIIQGMEKFVPSKILSTLPSDPHGGHQSTCKQWRPRTKLGRPGEMISKIINSGSSQLPPPIILSESSISNGWQKRLLCAPGYQKAQ